MTRKLEQITTAEAIERIENRIEHLRHRYFNNKIGPYEFTEAILLSMCDMLRGGFTR
jgi:hypothetical protein